MRTSSWLQRQWSDIVTTAKRHPWLPAMFGFLVPLIVPDIETWLKGQIGEGLLVLVKLLFIGTLVITTLLLVGRQRKMIDRLSTLGAGIGPTRPSPPRKGLFVLVSAGQYHEIPAYGAIKHHFRGENFERPEPTLRYLWLIHTAKPKRSGSHQQAFLTSMFRELAVLQMLRNSSYQNALDLKLEFEELGCKVELLSIENEYDAHEVFIRTMQAYEYSKTFLALKAEEIVADVTGGTKAMTIGLAYAGIPLARDLQLQKPRAFTADGRAIPERGADATLIDVNFVHKAGVLEAGTI